MVCFSLESSMGFWRWMGLGWRLVSLVTAVGLSVPAVTEQMKEPYWYAVIFIKYNIVWVIYLYHQGIDCVDVFRRLLARSTDGWRYEYHTSILFQIILLSCLLDRGSCFWLGGTKTSHHLGWSHFYDRCCIPKLSILCLVRSINSYQCDDSLRSKINYPLSQDDNSW